MKFFYNIFVISQFSALAAETQTSSQGYIVRLHTAKKRSNPVQEHLDKVRDLFLKEEKSLLASGTNQLGHVYNSTILGYSAKFTPSLLAKVQAMEEVEFIEKDGKASISLVQNNAPWGLARISFRGTYNYDYQFSDRGGEGVAVYIIDTGINVNHVEFQGRAYWGANMVYGSPNIDENGHGTHCAGTVGSRTYGVAKNVNLVAVKVLNSAGYGLHSDIIAGIDWAVSNPRGRRGNVINLSLGSGYSAFVNYAVRKAVEAGFIVSVAAGNDNKNACNVSPASESSVITVGAISFNNFRSFFSNWGPCLDIFAPGDQILSTWNSNNYATNYLSGTSMASPHVAGLAAYFLSKKSGASPAYIRQAILSVSLKGIVKQPGYNSPNNLLNNGGY